MMEIRTEIRAIWTEGYRPFVMGGSVYYPIGCKVECEGPHEIGLGYRAWVATAPNGRTFVAESMTGAIVGPTLEQVREDIRTGDPAIMKQQVAAAKQRAKAIEFTTPDKFWTALKCQIKS